MPVSPSSAGVETSQEPGVRPTWHWVFPVLAPSSCPVMFIELNGSRYEILDDGSGTPLYGTKGKYFKYLSIWNDRCTSLHESVMAYSICKAGWENNYEYLVNWRCSYLGAYKVYFFSTSRGTSTLGRGGDVYNKKNVHRQGRGQIVVQLTEYYTA